MSTMHESADVPAWPVYDLTVHEDGRVLVSGPLVPVSGHGTRASALDVVVRVAAGLGRAVRATATEPGGSVWRLIVSPEGEVSEVPDGGPRTAGPKKRRSRRRGKPASGGSTTAGPTTIGSETSVPRSATQKEPQSYEESLDQVENHLEAGRTAQAGALAALLDARATGVLGVSHPDTLHIREVRARATALAGDTVGGIQLYRDVAERWHYQGNAEQAEAVARRADQLWTQITHVEDALTAGVAVIRMRSQIPGPAGQALTAVLAHRDRLLQVRSATNRPPSRERPVADSPVQHGPRATLTWERPAVDVATRRRSAG
ncbi:hypothetical protein [Streptomyces sp. NPDC006285]|uniref:hypothetical protein n=1 Tax=Streptomyces sp. NPDC006285 TaxID=3364742 RepID=UPI0036A78A47